MNKRSRAFVVGYKLVIGLIALIAFIATVAQFGLNAWRFFTTFLLLLTALYFLISAPILLLSQRRQLDQNPCPMLAGMLLVGYLLVIWTSLTGHSGIQLDLPLVTNLLLYLVLPVLLLLDQIFLNRKGSWQAIYPLYWLALPVAYAAWIMLSANFLSTDVALYPLAFLNLAEEGITVFFAESLWYLLTILVFGYILFLGDFIISGRLAKRVVLPHIRVVELSDKELK